MKNFIKKVSGFVKSKFFRIKFESIPYLGKQVNVRNNGELRFGKNVIIRPSCDIFLHEKKSMLKIGDNVEIGNHSTLSSMNSIIIKEGVLTGPHVFISDHNHEYGNPNVHIYKQGAFVKGEVIIEEGCWIGTNVVIVGNVRIGRNCVIGANSVVTRDIPDYCLAIGSPAKIVKKYNFVTEQWEIV